MPKFKVHFESSCAVGVELEVEAINMAEASATAMVQWQDKGIADAVANLIEVDEHARKGFADTLGVVISHMTVSLDSEAGFEIVDVHTFQDDPVKDMASALQWLLDDMTDAEQHKDPNGDVEFDSVANARAKLMAWRDSHCEKVADETDRKARIDRCLAIAKKLNDKQRDKELTPIDVAGELGDAVYEIEQILQD